MVVVRDGSPELHVYFIPGVLSAGEAQEAVADTPAFKDQPHQPIAVDFKDLLKRKDWQLLYDHHEAMRRLGGEAENRFNELVRVLLKVGGQMTLQTPGAEKLLPKET